jgi:hypothetical protein
MKQTAVEWLIDKHFGGIENVTPYFKKHIDQAKAMEKEQIMNARINGDMNPRCISHLAKQYAELYYLETYGGESKT